MRVETEEFVLPVWVLCYIFNGDFSGLTDDELEKAAELEKTAQKLCDDNDCDNWCFGVETCDDPEFATHNDVDGYMGGDVQKVVLSMFAKE